MKFKPMQENRKKDTFQTMKVGQVARITGDHCYQGHIIVRSYMGWVNLTQPRADWAKSTNPTMEVEIFPVGVDLTFTTDV